MIVLALNCGSSTLKFQVISLAPAEGEEPRGWSLARGRIERLGGDASVSFSGEGVPSLSQTVRIANHEAAVHMALDWLSATNPQFFEPGENGIAAVGHRIVHGGAFKHPVVLDPLTIAQLESLEILAPLHNAASLDVVRAVHERLGARIPMVAVFDTSFHTSIPEQAALYAIPYQLSYSHGIRRYGFHGTSYRYMVWRHRRLTRAPENAAARLVAFHLGSGCSVTAIRDGRSVDTSMGLTPNDGLVMGTRSGDIDPSVFGVLARKDGLTIPEIDRLLSERSGLWGLSGRSADMKDLLEHEADHPRVRLAIDVFCYRARKYLGAYLAALGGAEAVLFSGGIGENVPVIRARICAEMEWCGITLDPELNARCVGREGEIGSARSRIRVFVIPTDEELVIAGDTAACLADNCGREAAPPHTGHASGSS